MINTKKAFLNRLRLCLSLKLMPEEVNEVVADYEGFFSAGTDEGKTEAELCMEFGTPKQVAKDIIRESDAQYIWREALAPVCIVLALYLTNISSWSFFSSCPRLHYTAIILLIPALCVLWKQRLTHYVPLNVKGRKQLAIIHIISLAFWFLDFLINTWCLAGFLIEGVPLPPFLPAPNKTGDFIHTIYCVAFTAITGILAVSLVLAWFKSSWFLTSAVHCLSAMTSLGSYMSFFKCMDIDFEIGFVSSSLPPLLTYLGLCITGTILTAFIVWRGKRHGRTA